MAFQTQLVRTADPQQMLNVAAVCFMANAATLHKCRLVMDRFLSWSAIGMAAQTNVDRIRLRQIPGTRWHADCDSRCNRRAAPGCCTFADSISLALSSVAGNAQVLDVGIASEPLCHLSPERGRCRSSCRQTEDGGTWPSASAARTGVGRGTAGSSRYRTAGSDAPSARRRLSDRGNPRTAQGRFSSSESGFRASDSAPVLWVTWQVSQPMSSAAMTAAFLRNIEPLRVASQAEIVFLVACGGLQQLVLVVRSVRIVALQAIPYRRFMDVPFDLGGVFVGVACEAKLVRGGGDQLYAGDVSIDPNLVAGQAAHRDGGVDGLAFCLVSVAFQALGARPPSDRAERGERPR